ncbi:alpha/beta hydrolase family protein [Paenibacillus sp. TC-CSREp1]|uniref:alpha/beta hydrolase family protein n=1 Tax=Paenibacillus sp. TC-CSREp1 TaxID=3410089 RepID=UPI003D03EBBF
MRRADGRHNLWQIALCAVCIAGEERSITAGKRYEGEGQSSGLFLQKEIGVLLENESALRSRSPITYASVLSGIDFLFIHGQADQLCPVEQTVRLYQEIREYKLALDEPSGRLELHIIDDLGHEMYSERFWAQKAVEFMTFAKEGQAKYK